MARVRQHLTRIESPEDARWRLLREVREEVLRHGAPRSRLVLRGLTWQDEIDLDTLGDADPAATLTRLAHAPDVVAAWLVLHVQQCAHAPDLAMVAEPHPPRFPAWCAVLPFTKDGSFGTATIHGAWTLPGHPDPSGWLDIGRMLLQPSPGAEGTDPGPPVHRGVDVAAAFETLAPGLDVPSDARTFRDFAGALTAEMFCRGRSRELHVVTLRERDWACWRFGRPFPAPLDDVVTWAARWGGQAEAVATITWEIDEDYTPPRPRIVVVAEMAGARCTAVARLEFPHGPNRSARIVDVRRRDLPAAAPGTGWLDRLDVPDIPLEPLGLGSA